MESKKISVSRYVTRKRLEDSANPDFIKSEAREQTEKALLKSLLKHVSVQQIETQFGIEMFVAVEVKQIMKGDLK